MKEGLPSSSALMCWSMLRGRGSLGLETHGRAWTLGVEGNGWGQSKGGVGCPYPSTQFLGKKPCLVCVLTFSRQVPGEIEPQLLCGVSVCLGCICSTTCCKWEIILSIVERQTLIASKSARAWLQLCWLYFGQLQLHEENAQGRKEDLSPGKRLFSKSSGENSLFAHTDKGWGSK